MLLLLGAALLSISTALAACGGGDSVPRPADAPLTVMFMGTSLTAGLGVDPTEAYSAVIQRKIEAEGLPHRVVNAGVSGETSAGALARADWLLAQAWDVLVLETGANDMLRGEDPSIVRANVQALIDRLRRDRPNARIVLVGMRRPPGLLGAPGQGYGALFEELAERNDLPLVRYLLEGVAGKPELNLSDGIHPNAAGHRQMAENVWEVLRDEL